MDKIKMALWYAACAMCGAIYLATLLWFVMSLDVIFGA